MATGNVAGANAIPFPAQRTAVLGKISRSSMFVICMLKQATPESGDKLYSCRRGELHIGMRSIAELFRVSVLHFAGPTLHLLVLPHNVGVNFPAPP